MTLDRVPSTIWSVSVRGQTGTQRVFTTRDEARQYRQSLRQSGTDRNRIVMTSFPVGSGVSYAK